MIISLIVHILNERLIRGTLRLRLQPRPADQGQWAAVRHIAEAAVVQRTHAVVITGVGRIQCRALVGKRYG